MTCLVISLYITLPSAIKEIIYIRERKFLPDIDKKENFLYYWKSTSYRRDCYKCDERFDDVKYHKKRRNHSIIIIGMSALLYSFSIV